VLASAFAFAFVVILSAAKDPEELTQPQPTEPFSPNNHPVPEFPQKYFQKLANFQLPNNDTNPTTIHHQPTTTSPQKHHTKTSPLPKPPSKNARKTTKTTPSTHQEKNLRKTGLGLSNGLEEQTGRRNS
jgi:hypothetical protein